MYMCARSINFASVSKMLRLDFGTLPSVVSFLFTFIFDPANYHFYMPLLDWSEWQALVVLSSKIHNHKFNLHFIWHPTLDTSS